MECSHSLISFPPALHKHLSPFCGAISLAAWSRLSPQRSVTFSALYSTAGPRGPGALWSSWNKLLCDRCHMKQRSLPIKLLSVKCFHSRSAAASQRRFCVWTLTNRVKVSMPQAIRACFHFEMLPEQSSPWSPDVYKWFHVCRWDNGGVI